MTLPEVLLWKQLKQWRQDGFHIRRQHPLGPYVLDFFCHERGLAIEVDGSAHSLGKRPEQDRGRDEWLSLRKIRTLRLPAHYVLSDMHGALVTIRAHLEDESLDPSP